MMNISDVVNDIIKKTEKDTRYVSYNGKSILNLPLHIPVGVSIIEFLSDIYTKYNKLLKESEKILNGGGVNDIDKLVSDVKSICDNIINVHKEFLNGRICHSYRALHRLASQVNHILVDIDADNTSFYRMRQELGLTSVNEFYHVPFNKIYLCNSQRFSIAGYPCFYIGYSLDVCKKEINETGTYVEMKLKDKITVIDMTWTAIDNSKFLLGDYLKTWPLIAACYIVPFWCKSQNIKCVYYKKENFKQEYIIPQLYTLYVRNNIPNVKGIRYYTSQNEKLEYGQKEYMNIVFFPDYEMEKQCDYDMRLMEKFKWGTPEDLT